MPFAPLSSRPAQRPVEVWGVSAYELAELVLLQAPAFAGRARLQVVHEHFQDAVAAIRQRLLTERCDVLLTAGANADFLRSQLDIPVVAVRVGGYDVMAALARARAVSDRIALILYREVPPEVLQFIRSFGLDLEVRAYETETDCRNTVAELARAGFRVVIGAGLAVRIAQDSGLAGLFLYSPASVAHAIEDAIGLARAQQLVGARGEMLSDVLQHLEDGVVAVDHEGIVLAANPAAAAFMEGPVGTAAGRPLRSVLPMLDAGPVIAQGQGEASVVYEMRQQKVVVDSTPLLEAGRPVGAVFTLHRPAAVEQAFGRLRAHSRARSARYTLQQVVQQSSQMQDIVRRCETLAARSDATVLVTGPSGVGKEMLAQGIHNASRRRAHAFVPVNCGALTESLVESEFFGYEDGAFTGARRHGKAGFFETAHRGTLFLDEIAELPLHLQTLLLRVLQEREVTRVGGVMAIPVDIRIVAATHRDLPSMVRDGSFREDLYYRVAVLRVDVPPLRERPADVLALAQRFVTAALREAGAARWLEPVLDGLPAAVAGLAWPGNGRELDNFCRRVAIACAERDAPLNAADMRTLVDNAPMSSESAESTPGLAHHRKLQERSHAEAVLAACGGDQAEAARQLGISRTTLWRKLRA